MDVLILLTTAGADTGPLFDLYENSTGPTTFTILESNVPKIDLTNPLGYSVSGVSSGTTVIRVQSKGVCPNYYDIVLVPDTTSSSTSTTTTTILCELWRNDTLSEVTVTYTNCEGVVLTNQSVATTSTICARPGSITPSGVLTNIGTCTPLTSSSSTTTTTTTCAVYYELSGCNPGDYAFTKVVPTLGAGQQYVLPGSPNVYYTYTGVSSTYCIAPTPYNASIQATANIGCL
jgi:hypothetical protein